MCGRLPLVLANEIFDSAFLSADWNHTAHNHNSKKVMKCPVYRQAARQPDRLTVSRQKKKKKEKKSPSCEENRSRRIILEPFFGGN